MATTADDFDYYDILGLDKNVDESQIKKAYYKKAREWHPDRNPNKPNAEEMFKKISEAYSVLSDENKKKKYDKYGKDGLDESSGMGHGGPGMAGFSHFTTRGDADEIFKHFFAQNSSYGGMNSFFSSSGGPDPMLASLFENIGGMGSIPQQTIRRTSTSAPNLPQEKPTTLDIECSIRELYFGTTKRFRISRRVVDSMGATRNEIEEEKIDIQPGMKDGAKFTFQNKGNRVPGKKSGDVIIILREKVEPNLMIYRNNIIKTVKISLRNALNGFRFTVKDLDGENHEITCESMTHSNHEEIIEGKGMPIRKKGEQIGQGDMIIRFNIQLSDADTA